MNWVKTIHNHSQLPSAIQNYPQRPKKPSTTTRKHPQPSTTIHNHPQLPKNYPKKTKLVIYSYFTALSMLILKQTLTLIVAWNNGSIVLLYTCVCVSVCIYFTRHYIYYVFVRLIVCFCQHSKKFI